MPKRAAPPDPKAQSARFKSEAARMIEAGELDAEEGERVLRITLERDISFSRVRKKRP